MTAEFKHAVTVAEMARMVGLSRSRFYQLIGRAVPAPTRDEHGRPYYTEEQQKVVLDVRRRNCGIDGKPILFYAPRHSVPAPTRRRMSQQKQVKAEQHTEVIDGVRGLGLTTATAAQVDQAIKELFPGGLQGVDPGQVIRSVFLSIKRRDSAGNVG